MSVNVNCLKCGIFGGLPLKQNTMRLRRKRGRLELVLLFGALLVLTSGCDRVRTISQRLQLQVVDSVSGKPVKGIRVQIKSDFERFGMMDEQHQRESWEGLPWFFATTNEDGIANVEIVETAIDKSRGDKPPSSRDVLTGHSYLFIIGEGNEHAKEGLRLRIEKGARRTEGNLALVVLDFDEPIYTATPGTTK